MNVIRYYPVDMVNGPGTRCTLFVAGCEHKCSGCYNAVSWSPRAGEPYSLQLEAQILDDLCSTEIPRQGLSLTGGDPLFPLNLPTIERLLRRVKQLCPEKDIWLWTGYTLETLSDDQRRVIGLVDVLVDGRFDHEQADRSLLWRGSRNQRVLALSERAIASGQISA